MDIQRLLALIRLFFSDAHVHTQRHKLGTNLTPVTPESFAVWKKTRMDKKDAEAEAIKKAKDAQAAAGKNSGMSGRDLVSSNKPSLPLASVWKWNHAHTILVHL